MTDENKTEAATPVAPQEVTLEQRVTELEAVVHAIAHVADPSKHGVVLPWLERVGARIKALL